MFESQKNISTLPLIAFLIVWILLAIFSYTQRDLNLTLFNISFFQNIQKYLVNIGYFNRPLTTGIFVLISGLLIYLYIIILQIKESKLDQKMLFIILTMLLVGLLAYPMFSHDIFNYLFNAKMVLVYHVNPHIHSALEFPKDPWVRFMHNVHTPAPYGYGWTAISLLPVFLGLPKFTTSLWLTKLLIAAFWVLEAWCIWKLAQILLPKQAQTRLLLFVFNPLILTETFIMGHNDSVMMGLFLLALLVLFKNKILKIWQWFMVIALGLLSVLTKYASIVLVPFVFLKNRMDFFTWGGLALLMVPLSRLDQLHSWYFQWGILLLILSKKWWGVALAFLISVGGLLRYAPFVYFGNWDMPVPVWRNIILVLPLVLLFQPRIRSWFKQL